MRLYHFIEPQYLLSSILKNQIKLSTIATLNDPYEMMPSFPEADGTYPPICRVRERMLDILKNTGIFSMTANLKSPALWAHYAAKHRGVALEFDIPEERLGGVEPIQYTNQRVVIGPSDDMTNPDVFERKFKEMIRTKATCWKYEDEYRWVFRLQRKDVYMDEAGLFYRHMPEELTRIILGIDCILLEDGIRKALEWVGFGDISITRARMSDAGFEIIVDG